jgi:hypothetical protein
MASKFEPALRLLLQLSKRRDVAPRAAALQAAHVLDVAEEDTGLSPFFLAQMSKLDLCGDPEQNAASSLREARLFGDTVRKLPLRTQKSLRGLVVVAEALYPKRTQAILRL